MNIYKSKSKKQYKCLMVMPPFHKHAHRRNWDKLEEFYNPEGTFKEIHIVSIADNYNYASYKIGTLIIHPIKTNKTLWEFSQIAAYCYSFIYKATIKTYQIAKKEKIDLLVQRYGGPVYHGISVVIVGMILHIKFVLTIQTDHEMADKYLPQKSMFTKFKQIVLKYAINKTSTIWSVSEHITKQWIDKGIDKARFTVIPNKEIIDKFKTKPDNTKIKEICDKHFKQINFSTNKIILTVGRLMPGKNIDNMIRAFKNISNNRKDIHYIIIGDGPMLSELTKLIDTLELTKKITIYPYLNHSNLTVLYHISSLLLFTTLYEGQGRVIYEALACGLPIICSNYGCPSEMIKDNITGYHADPFNSEDIAKALSRALKEVNLKKRMYDDCIKEAIKYDLDRINKMENKFYLKILSDDPTV